MKNNLLILLTLFLVSCNKVNVRLAETDYEIAQRLKVKLYKLPPIWKEYIYLLPIETMYAKKDTNQHIEELYLWIPSIDLPEDVYLLKNIRQLYLRCVRSMPNFSKFSKTIKTIVFEHSDWGQKSYNWEIKGAKVDEIRFSLCFIQSIKFSGKNNIKRLSIRSRLDNPTFEYEPHSLDSLEILELREEFNFTDFGGMPSLKKIIIGGLKSGANYQKIKRKYPHILLE